MTNDAIVKISDLMLSLNLISIVFHCFNYNINIIQIFGIKKYFRNFFLYLMKKVINN
jgi:hypothetical protein